MKPGLILNQAEILRKFAPLAAPPISKSCPIPNRIDRRDEMLPASDQGSTSECAAYSIAGIIESINWRDTGIFTQIDPGPIYAEAKRNDGYPGDGTTLDAVLNAVVKLGLMAKPKEIFTIEDREGYYRALHRYGFVHLAFNITDAWSNPETNGELPDDAKLPLVGGHAVVGCGYNRAASGWNAIQNSWNDSLGWHGFMRMSHAQFDRQFMYGLAWK